MMATDSHSLAANTIELTKFKILPVGRAFGAFLAKLHNKDTALFTRSNSAANLNVESMVDSDLFDDDFEFTGVDAKEWKKQDHYAVLGLSKIRRNATQEQLKAAHRRRVLQHHPDKKAAAASGLSDDAAFKCISKAYEILSDPEKRRQFDSVDPLFDEEIPDKSDIMEEGFFKVLSPVFARNSLFSIKQPVPVLGDMNSCKADVEAFYEFWYAFESWRTFEYLDEDDIDGGDNRLNKRHIEKKNKAARQKRKMEDNARIRKLTDLALQNDPRIKLFKAAEKAEKEAKKIAREADAKAEANAKAAAKEKEKLEAEKQAVAAKEAAAEAKKIKEAQRNAIRKEKKAIRTAFTDEYKYFLHADQLKDIKLIEEKLMELELFFESSFHNGLDDLNNFRKRFTEAGSLEKAKTVYENKKNNVEAEEEISEAATNAAPSNTSIESPFIKEEGEELEWTVQEVSLLIKAVNQFKPGTVERWEKIGDYHRTHTTENIKRNNDALISKSKSLKQDGKSAEEDFTLQKKKPVDPKIYQNTPTVAVDVLDAFIPWNATEQQNLELALQKFPSSRQYSSPDERWQLISNEVSGRSAQECKDRFKDLAKQLKSKNK